MTHSLQLVIKKAVKSMGRLRLALTGPAGCGKTWTALGVATVIAKATGKRILVIDTERGSAAKYAGDATFGGTLDFDVLELNDSHHPGAYIEALKMAEASGEYGVIVVDSLSHAWAGKDGALSLVDQAAKRSNSGNTYTAWRDVTPLQTALIDSLNRVDANVIVTMRSKTEYVMEVGPTGKTSPRKVGMAPIQRDGVEYEFDVVGEMTIENGVSFAKTRCAALKGKFFEPNGLDGTDYATLATTLSTWLSDGAPADAENEILAEKTIGDAPVTAADAKATCEVIEKVLPALKAVPPPAPPTFAEAVEAIRAQITPDAFSACLAFFDVKDVNAITEKGARANFYKMLQKAAPKTAGTSKGSRLAHEIK